METRASYILVGSFVLLLFGGTLGFIIWLITGEVGGPQVRYLVIYEGSVTGLREGSAVRMNGVKVGDVVSVALDKTDPSKVRILLQVSEDTPVQSDTKASLELEGLAGGRYLQLSGGEPGAPALKKTPGERYPVIPSDPSSFQQILDSAPEVLAQINSMLKQANKLLSDENLKNISATFKDLATISDALARNADKIDGIVSSVEETLGSLSNAAKAIEDFSVTVQEDAVNLVGAADDALRQVASLAQRLREGLDEASGDLKRLVAEVTQGASNFSSMTGQISQMVAENREPLRDFTAQGLFELINFLTEARELVSSLKAITVNIERDPARFLFGDQQEGYEPQQR